MIMIIMIIVVGLVFKLLIGLTALMGFSLFKERTISTTKELIDLKVKMFN